MTEANEAARLLGQRGASKGGKARAKKLTPERRKEIASAGGKAAARRRKKKGGRP